MKRVEWIYETMIGEAVSECPGVADEFAPGAMCDRLYGEIYEANKRLCERLGVEDDEDVEIIINHFLSINQELCMRMYYYGVMDGTKYLPNAPSQCEDSSTPLRSAQNDGEPGIPLK